MRTLNSPCDDFLARCLTLEFRATGGRRSLTLGRPWNNLLGTNNRIGIIVARLAMKKSMLIRRLVLSCA